MREEPATANVTDRLSSTLFVAALFHGIVILGITFTASPLGDGSALPTLRITLIADGPGSEDPSEDADYLAQRSQIGSGELATGDRPSTTLAADNQRLPVTMNVSTITTARDFTTYSTRAQVTQ